MIHALGLCFRLVCCFTIACFTAHILDQSSILLSANVSHKPNVPHNNLSEVKPTNWSLMAFHYLNVIVASVLFLAIIPQVDANAAYVYYEDAQCTSGGYIKGKLIFAFDTYTMKGNGFTIKKYEGPCKYFENGRHDLEYNNGNDGSFMKNGYCIT